MAVQAALQFFVPLMVQNRLVLQFIRSLRMDARGKRLEVDGFENRKNSILFYPSSQRGKDAVVFFGGDSQDYVEIMEKHRENRRHSQWNLESTAEILSRKFPGYNILIVKPAKMYLGTFSIFSNFVPSNDYGVPDFKSNYNSWQHLKLLIENIFAKIFGIPKQTYWTNNTQSSNEPRIILIGFSKGCVVLNQLVVELPTVIHQAINNDLVNRVTDLYWLDGGHVGGKNTWITDVSILTTLSSLNWKIHVHVTPYQIQDPRRPYLGKEEKKFSDNMLKLSPEKFVRKLHFENEEPSLENHFNLLNVFEPDKPVKI